MRILPYRIVLILLLLCSSSSLVNAQGNKLNISATPAKNMSVCGYEDTSRIAIYNISSSQITSIKATLILPAGVTYIKGSLAGTGVTESNITNLNRPVFAGPNLLIAQNFQFRVRLKANCDIIPAMSGSNTPQIDVRVDYTGNFDVGSSIPFVPLIPSPGYAAITNLSFIGNVGDKFVRKVTLTNYGKGPLRNLQLLRINGKDISGVAQTGFSTKKSGDTLRTSFTTADFAKVGDKDTLLEQNESVIITDTFTINGCVRTGTYYEIGWGCDGKVCQIIKNNGSVTISSDNPVIKTWTSSVDNYCYNGSTLNAQYLTATNTGKKDAKDLTFLVYIGTAYTNSFFDTTRFKYRINSGPTKTLHMDTAYQYTIPSACVGTKAIDYVRLKFPKLSPKDTVYITWDMTRCVSGTCGYAFYDLNWIYSTNYKNQCNNVISSAAAWGKVYRYNGGSVAPWVPTDLAPDQTKDFKFTFNSFYDLPLTSTGQIRIDFILPKTLTHSLSKNDFFIVNGSLSSTWYPDSVAWRKDTLRAFMGKAFPFNLTNGELTVRLKGTCSKFSSNALLPVDMSLYYNPQPNCNPFWIKPICASFNVKVHCSKVCAQGLNFNNFDATRTSFGLPDNNNDGVPDPSGSLDMSKVRTERVQYGDTFQTVFYGRPKTNGTFRNWRYGYAESYITYGSYVDVVEARIIVQKGITVQTGNCNTVRVKKIVSGAHATFKFDFTVDSIYPKGCLSSTYRYSANDSIRLIVTYRVTKNISGTAAVMNFSNRFYFGSVANPSPSQSYQCDTFGANLLLYGYYYANCCADNVVYSNCAEITLSQSWYLGMGACCQNYAGNNLFPYEFRNFTKLKALRIHLPNGLKLGQTYFGQYRTTGVGTYQLQRKDTVPNLKGTTNPYVFDFRKYYTDSGGWIKPGDDGVQGYFSYNVQPRCNLPANTPIRIDYDYIFERSGTFGKGYDTISTKTNGSPDYFTFTPPVLSLTPAIPTVYAYSDTVEWELRYTNPSSSFNAYNIWLSPKPSTNIKVVEIRDAVTDTLIKPTKDIYRAGVLGAAKMRRFKVRAVFTSCNPDSLVMYGSYNCAEYPIDFASYPCTPNKATLYLEPQNTRLQMTLTDSAKTLDLCATNKLTLLLENIQAVSAFNTKVRISLPIGMNVISSSVQLRYPLNSSPVGIGAPKLVSGTVYEWDLAALNSKIAAGFRGTTDTAKNKLLITLRVTTNCDYASGSFVSARGVANLKCGNAIPSIPGFSNPLDIKGVTRPYYTLVKSWADTLLPCQKPMYVKTRVIYLGPGKSGSKDRIEVFLPFGTYLDTSYWNAIRNAPAKDSLQIKNINGAQLLSWLMPKGVVPGDSMEFDIRVQGKSQDITCGPADVITRSVVVQPVICVTTNTSCDIKVITGSELATPWVDKGSIDLISPTIKTALVSSDSERVQLSYIVKNNGRYMSSSSPIIVRFHYDKNANGKYDKSDPWIASDTLKALMNPGSSKAMSRNFVTKAGYSCGILAVTDSAACACLFGQRMFPVPSLQNAGRDTAICSGKALRLGAFNTSGFKYKWNDDQVINKDTLALPDFTGVNQTGLPEAYNLVLTTNRGLCITKDTVKVTVYANPTLKTTLKDTQICEKAIVTLSAKTTAGNGGNKYSWNPSSGLTNATSLTTNAKPASNTTYRITVVDAKGCTASDTSRIKVNPFPRAWFTWPVTCQGNDVPVDDSSFISKGSIALRIWKVPGNDTFGVKQIKVATGTFSSVNVTLIAESDIGCADTVTRKVDVKANPKVRFTIADICAFDSSRFVNTSTIDSGSISAWKWTFGDSAVSSLKAPVHKYSSYGRYGVKLIAYSQSGCADSLSDSTDVYPMPSASIAVAPICDRDTLRYAGNVNLYGDTLQTQEWTWAQGGAIGQNKPLRYADTFGSYSARYMVKTIHGCADTTMNTVAVHAVPRARFTSSTVCLDSITKFNDGSSIQKGSIVTYRWTMGDGRSYVGKPITHRYKDSGVYLTELKVISDKGCRDSVARFTRVHPLAIPSITANSHCLGESVTATSSVKGGGPVAKYKWYTGNGDSSQLKDLTYQYKAVGTYTLRLIVSTDSGCVRETSTTVETWPKPIPSATAVNPCSDDSVRFLGSAVVSSGTIGSRYWVMDSIGTFTGNLFAKRVSPPRTQKGTYHVATNRNCRDSISVTTVVYPPVALSISGSSVCIDEPTTFKHSLVSVVPASQFAWRFGDGQSSSDPNPTYTYKKTVLYKTELTINTVPGCMYTAGTQNEVYPRPIPGFELNPKTGTIVNPDIQITDQSFGADTLFYRTTDRYFTQQRSFMHTFPDSGTYKIFQVATSKFGCKDSTVDSVYINFMYTLHVPDVFTPNSDVKNEVFGPGGMGISWYSMKIYSRWGELIYLTENSQPWDGSIMGKPAPEGVYAVLISLRDYKGKRHYYQGSITVLR